MATAFDNSRFHDSAGNPDVAVPRSISRVLDLLETVLANGQCNLTAAADQAELTPTTALRHLRALEARGYLQRSESGVFSAGPTMLRIAASLHEHGPLERLVSVAQPHLDQLATQTGESAYLVVADRRVASYIATAHSNRAIRHVGWVGQTVPLEETAVGAALAQPGVVAKRTGAVEADITAVSLGLPGSKAPALAISVIGPQHRLSAAALKSITAAMEESCAALVLELGLQPVVA